MGKKRKVNRKKLRTLKETNAIPKDDLYYPSTYDGQIQKKYDEGVVYTRWCKMRYKLQGQAIIYYNMSKYHSGAHILLNGLEQRGVNLGPDIERMLTKYIILFDEYWEADDPNWFVDNNPQINTDYDMYSLSIQAHDFNKIYYII